MKRIGITSDGYLVEITTADLGVLRGILLACDDADIKGVAVLPADAAEAPHKFKTCAMCGTSFTPRTSEKTCSPECRRKRLLSVKRQIASTTTTPARQAKRQALGLTKDAKAKRLETLKALGAKMGLRDENQDTE